MRLLWVAALLCLFSGEALAGYGPKPHAWCGWWLRTQMWNDPGAAYNRAAEWAKYGTRAQGPAPGVIAVFPHHVGRVTGVPRKGVIEMISGNDAKAVRQRERSTRGVIAWRWP